MRTLGLPDVVACWRVKLPVRRIWVDPRWARRRRAARPETFRRAFSCWPSCTPQPTTPFGCSTRGAAITENSQLPSHDPVQGFLRQEQGRPRRGCSGRAGNYIKEIES